jgi:hypothetical protein
LSHRIKRLEFSGFSLYICGGFSVTPMRCLVKCPLECEKPVGPIFVVVAQLMTLACSE